jgi:hypothetical protein
MLKVKKEDMALICDEYEALTELVYEFLSDLKELMSTEEFQNIVNNLDDIEDDDLFERAGQFADTFENFTDNIKYDV